MESAYYSILISCQRSMYNVCYREKVSSMSLVVNYNYSEKIENESLRVSYEMTRTDFTHSN